MRSHRTYLPSPVSKSFPQRGIRPAAPRPPFPQLQEPCGISLSPLTDSNRRPPPYHVFLAATGRNRRQRFAPFWALWAALPFATDCHQLRPLGSINAPSLWPRPRRWALIHGLDEACPLAAGPASRPAAEAQSVDLGCQLGEHDLPAAGLFVDSPTYRRRSAVERQLGRLRHR